MIILQYNILYSIYIYIEISYDTIPCHPQYVKKLGCRLSAIGPSRFRRRPHPWPSARRRLGGGTLPGSAAGPRENHPGHAGRALCARGTEGIAEGRDGKMLCCPYWDQNNIYKTHGFKWSNIDWKRLEKKRWNVNQAVVLFWLTTSRVILT